MEDSIFRLTEEHEKELFEKVHIVFDSSALLSFYGYTDRISEEYFNKIFNNRNIYAVVNPKQDWIEPSDPYELTMVDLMDRKVLPESTDKMIKDKGYFDETALMLKWMTGSITDYNTRI